MPIVSTTCNLALLLTDAGGVESLSLLREFLSACFLPLAID
jgi:hypothetical protein